MKHSPRRMTARRLAFTEQLLNETENVILRDLASVHAATSRQLTRLAFPDGLSPTHARLTRRALQNLAGHGLARRFGHPDRGHRVTSVYALTPAGVRLVAGRSSIGGARARRTWIPSPLFLAHRLSITELAVQLREASHRGELEVLRFEAEPDCWRFYSGSFSERLNVKPDALVRLGVGADELSWFIEVDRGSESVRTLARKCTSYRDYEQAGLEQRRHSVFPGVLFVVPDADRLRVVQRVISRQPPVDRALFAVATDDEAVAVLTQEERRQGSSPNG